MGKVRKRSIISFRRLTELRNGNIYEVKCGTSDCPCGDSKSGCERGFFSLFMQAIYGIQFASRHNISYYINYGNRPYLYSYQNNTDPNFWNYFFNQPIKSVENPCSVVVNHFNEIYPLRIWNRNFCREIHREVMCKLDFNEGVSSAVKQVKKNIKGKNVLGVHWRGTDHYQEVPPVKLKAIFRKIDIQLKNMDYLFLATDEQSAVEAMRERYGDKLVINDVTRSTNHEAVHLNKQHKDKFKLGLDALMDCYALSLCKKAILTHSNLSYVSLFFNPELDYLLMEQPSSKIKRWKTLLLFYLDKWNIRKW